MHQSPLIGVDKYPHSCRFVGSSLLYLKNISVNIVPQSVVDTEDLQRCLPQAAQQHHVSKAKGDTKIFVNRQFSWKSVPLVAARGQDCLQPATLMQLNRPSLSNSGWALQQGL
jgi:hypothetical protein